MATSLVKQTDRGITVAFKEQTTIGTPSSGASAEKLRFGTSPGLQLDTANVAPTESRDDGLQRAPGLGRKTVTGSYNGPLSLASYDTIIKSVWRNTFTADATIAQSDMSSATIGVSSGVVTASGGSFITAGAFVGAIAQPGTGFDSADQSQNCVIAALTATTMTLVRFDGTAITDVGAGVSTWSITIKKNIIQGTTDCAYTVEQYRNTPDKSEVFEWCRFGSVDLNVGPDAEVGFSTSLLGRNQVVETTGNSPVFTSPTEYTSEALQSARAKLVIGSSVAVGLANFTFGLNLNLFRDQTTDELTNEIGIGLPTLAASATILEDDLSRVSSYLAGTETTASVIFEEPDSAPKDFIGLSFSKVKFGAATSSNMGQDQFSTRTFPFLIDADLRGGAYKKTGVIFSTSSS